MSARALRYAIDAGEGRIIADRLSGFHDLPRTRVNPKAVLEQLARVSDPSAYLHGFQPDNAQYAALKRALADTEPPRGKPVVFRSMASSNPAIKVSSFPRLSP